MILIFCVIVIIVYCKWDFFWFIGFYEVVGDVMVFFVLILEYFYEIGLLDKLENDIGSLRFVNKIGVWIW